MDRESDDVPALPASVQSRARRAGEWGRVRLGLTWGLATLPVSALALALCHHPWRCVAVAAALFVLVVVLAWRGQGWLRGVAPGLLAGALPLAGMGVARLAGHQCMHGFCTDTCLPACLAGAIAAGLVAARLSARRDDEVAQGVGIDGRAVTGMLLVGGVTLTMGCMASGLGGVFGLAAGVGLGLAPGMIASAVAARGQR